MNTNYTKEERAKRWVMYCVIPTFCAFFLAVGFDLYLGYSLISVIKNHYYDLFLTIFSILVSIFASAVDFSINILPKTREKYLYFSGGSALLIMAFYSFAYSREEIFTLRLLISLVIVLFFAILVIRMGYKFEIEERIDNSKTEVDTVANMEQQVELKTEPQAGTKTEIRVKSTTKVKRRKKGKRKK